MRYARGITLVEVLIATVVMTVAAVGVLSYEYQAARQARVSRAHTAAVRTGYLVLEDWKANGGSGMYAEADSRVHTPLLLGMGFGYVGGGVYRVTVDNFLLEVTLSRNPDNLYSRLTEINVKVQWPLDSGRSFLVSDDPSIQLTSYARIDQSDG